MGLSSKMLPQSSRGVGAVSRHLALLLILVLALAWSGTIGPAAAQERPTSTPKDGFDPKKQFTIVKIEPDPGKEVVRISFSQPLLVESLRDNLRLLPWSRSTGSAPPLTLKGC